ncbi:MAG: hypothetical protein LQ350_004091 [Teloschistes chrysophthalmus]|nr:MAG: hypothetical protein LQ350_004091 [Niorma chrysophthalma]
MPLIQAAIGHTPQDITLKGKTVIVTGANAGIGFEVARQYLELGSARVILAVRSVGKGEVAAKFLSHHPSLVKLGHSPDIKVMHLDLDDFNSVHTFAQKVQQEIDTLDILLLNGGVNLMSYQTSASGHERVMQVNYHSNVLLALLLLPLLESTATKRGQPTRLTFVGSGTMTMHTLKNKPLLDNETVAQHFDDKSRYFGMMRYSDSKLMIAAFTQEMAARVSSDKVIINNLCPGMVATAFDTNLPLYLRTIMSVVRKVRARDVETGGRTYVYATCVLGKESHGCFVSSNRISEPDILLSRPEGKELKRKAWAEAIEQAKKLDPSFQAPHTHRSLE